MAPSVVSLVGNIKQTVMDIAPSVSMTLIVAGAIVYGLAHTQPAENRGKWQTLAGGMIIGGIIVAVIWGGVTAIFNASATILT